MSKTYITDITHFLDEAGELGEMPGPARELASFLTLLIDATTTTTIPVRECDTHIRCRARACRGSTRVSLASFDEVIVWNCPECGHNGTIRNWQGTKWNRQSQAGCPTQRGPLPGTHAKTLVADEYTPRQGQFLAFIYYYTKIHRLAPAELDMQKYFGISASAVHQMMVTLENRGFIERQPGHARSIRLLVPRERLPDLE
ncbi:MAG: LexA family protein [Pirellulales bacterium]